MFLGLLILVLFLTGALVCFLWGVGMAFSAVYLPTLVMFSNTAPFDLPGLTDVTPPIGVIAGMVFGLVLKGGEPLLFRWTLMDTVVVLLAVSATITGWVNSSWWTGVHEIGEQALEFVLPYFAARVAFHTPAARKTALGALIACACFMALFAPIEMRMWPYWYNRLMSHLTPRATPIVRALTRWGFFRAAVSFLHPIDFGNGALIITGMIATLAAATTAGLRNIYVQAGLAAGGVCLLTSLSFGPFFGAAFTFGFVLILVFSRIARRSLTLMVALAIVGVIVLTFVLLDVDARVSPTTPPLERSFRIRAVIVQNSWDSMSTAGFFGWGEKITQARLNLKSVDNTYMMWAMTRGWVFTTLWIAMPVIIAVRVQRSMSRARNLTEVIALATSAATILGINIAMFTVWAGSIYARLWLVLLAFTISLTEWFLNPAVLPQPQFVRGGLVQPAAAVRARPRRPALAGGQ